MSFWHCPDWNKIVIAIRKNLWLLVCGLKTKVFCFISDVLKTFIEMFLETRATIDVVLKKIYVHE